MGNRGYFFCKREEDLEMEGGRRDEGVRAVKKIYSELCNRPTSHEECNYVMTTLFTYLKKKQIKERQKEFVNIEMKINIFV